MRVLLLINQHYIPQLLIINQQEWLKAGIRMFTSRLMRQRVTNVKQSAKYLWVLLLSRTKPCRRSLYPRKREKDVTIASNLSKVS